MIYNMYQNQIKVGNLRLSTKAKTKLISSEKAIPRATETRTITNHSPQTRTIQEVESLNAPKQVQIIWGVINNQDQISVIHP